MNQNPSAEWLEADGLGGFASGTVGGPRTRRYHALLLAALTPPTGRTVLVDGFDAWLERGDGAYDGGSPTREFLTRQRYAPNVTTTSSVGGPGFEVEPWPAWTWQLGSDATVECELFVPHGSSAVVLRWRATGLPAGLTLVVRPFLSGRDAHALHHENPGCDSGADVHSARVRWQPYPSLPAVLSASNGDYHHAPVWYRNFELDEERDRGFDHTTDCFSPGELRWDLSQGEAVWMLAAEGLPGVDRVLRGRPLATYRSIRSAELRRRARFPSRLHRSADSYLVARGAGKTIIAGYPWFTDWGRDTFIALRGLCLATGRLDEARDILLAWAETVSQGMVPNRFVDQGDAPEFNAVDASLWFVVAAWEYLQAAPDSPARVPLERAIHRIVQGYADGTRYGIRADGDGLLLSGEPGVQLTWMDARVGDWVVTPRIGKPVEVQALWLNALRIASGLDAGLTSLLGRGLASFGGRFWNPDRECLYDVVDADRIPGRVDGSIRPNQIFAVGGLPFPLLEGDRARQVFGTVKRLLHTPLGLRSLAPGDGAYVPHYRGGPRERDAAYHQGTVWPWLAGAFGEAWLRVEGNTDPVRAQIRQEVVQPLLAHLGDAGLGHISEIADAEPPHTPRGCPFQAWSLGELIRLVRLLDQGEGARAASRSGRRRKVAGGQPSRSGR